MTLKKRKGVSKKRIYLVPGRISLSNWKGKGEWSDKKLRYL